MKSCPDSRDGLALAGKPPVAHRQHPASPGFTLLEALGFILVFALVANVCFSLLSTGWRMNALHARGLARMRGLMEVRAEFSEQVRQAAGVAEAIGPYTTDGTHVVLRMPRAEGGERFTVFGDLRGDHRLARAVYEQRGDALDMLSMRTYHVRLDPIRFAYDTPNPTRARLVTLTAALEQEEDERPVAQVEHHFAAAPRGEGAP